MLSHLRFVMLAATLFAASNQCSGAPEPKGEGKDRSNNKGKIEGTKWSSEAATIKGNTIPAGSLTLEFTKDGKVTYTAGPSIFTGTYTLNPGDEVVLKLDQELAGSKKHVEKVVIKDDKLTMSDKDGTSLTFEKVK